MTSAKTATLLEGREHLAIEAELLRHLAEINGDFRESIRMVPAERAPRARWWPVGEGPMSTQDPRIKKRYIL